MEASAEPAGEDAAGPLEGTSGVVTAVVMADAPSAPVVAAAQPVKAAAAAAVQPTGAVVKAEGSSRMDAEMKDVQPEGGDPATVVEDKMTAAGATDGGHSTCRGSLLCSSHRFVSP